jgi:hypothetical protein
LAVVETPELTLRARRSLVYGSAAIGVVSLVLAIWTPGLAVVGVLSLIGTAEALRVVLIVRDGTLYRRWFVWSAPFLLDSLVGVRMDWIFMRHLPREELTMYDRTGQECSLSLDVLEGMGPLLEYVLYRLETDPSIRREPTTVARLEHYVRRGH